MNGNGKLTLSCVEKDGFVQVKVGDTGCGTPEKHMSQIFTPFFTTKAPGSGTGLGLSNCNNIVEKMGAASGSRVKRMSVRNLPSFSPSTRRTREHQLQLVNDRTA
jgi:C4-dicarboxylate-specific signal transduction histidine kinase